MSGSYWRSYSRARCAAIACRSSGMPGPGGYWLTASGHRRRGDRQHRWRAVGVGEALAEVDRAGGGGERAHLGEDRGAEAAHPLDEPRHEPPLRATRRVTASNSGSASPRSLPGTSVRADQVATLRPVGADRPARSPSRPVRAGSRAARRAVGRLAPALHLLAVPARWAGSSPSTRESASALPLSHIGVAIAPGSIRHTRTPCGASSRRSESIQPRTANFEARVRRQERQRHPAADRAGVDDPASGLEQRRQQRLGDRDVAEQVDLELPSPLRQGHHLERSVDVHPGVVDQRRDPAVGAFEDLRTCRPTDRVRDVEHDGGGTGSGSGSSRRRRGSRRTPAASRSALARPIPVLAPVMKTNPMAMPAA